MLIRIAVKEDAPNLVAFNQAMALETEGRTLDSRILQNGVEAVFQATDRGFYLVAEVDDKIVGGLMITFEWSDWRNSWFWWIQSVYILPEYRGRKIYSLMYAFVKELADEKGNVCGFRLYVEHDNENAQKVYKRLGMESSHYKLYEELI